MRVRLAAHPKGNLHENVVQLRHYLLQRGDVTRAVDLGKPWLDRLHAARIHARFIHAGAVVISDDLRSAALGGVLVSSRRLQNLAQPILRRLPRLPPPAPPRHRRRDRIVCPPSTIGELIEVIARLRRAIEIVQVDPMQRRVL